MKDRRECSHAIIWIYAEGGTLQGMNTDGRNEQYITKIPGLLFVIHHWWQASDLAGTKQRLILEAI